MNPLERAIRRFGSAADLSITINERNLRKKPLNDKLLDAARQHVDNLGLKPYENPRMLMQQCLGAIEAQDGNHVHAARMQRIMEGTPNRHDRLWLERELLDQMDHEAYVEIPPEYSE